MKLNIYKSQIGNLIIKPKSIFTKVALSVVFSLILFSSASPVDELSDEMPIHYGYLKLYITASNSIRYTEFYFNSNATQGLDPGYDTSVYGGTPPPFAIYSHLVQNNTGIAFAVQALSDTDMNNITVPLGINASQGQEILLSIAETDIPQSINIYIEDRETNTLTLLNENTYSFTAATNLSGTGRFFVKFEADALSTIEQTLDRLKIYSDSSNHTLVIKGALDSDTELRLFDINGRLINYLVLDEMTTKHTLNIGELDTGVYIVKLKNKNSESFTQKIIIQ
jgi:hypothetical protein